MSRNKMLTYERKEKKIIDRIAADSKKLKKMQDKEVKKIKQQVKKHHK